MLGLLTNFKGSLNRQSDRKFSSEDTFFTFNIVSIFAFILPVQIGLIFGKDHPRMDAETGIRLL